MGGQLIAPLKDATCDTVRNFCQPLRWSCTRNRVYRCRRRGASAQHVLCGAGTGPHFMLLEYHVLTGTELQMSRRWRPYAIII